MQSLEIPLYLIPDDDLVLHGVRSLRLDVILSWLSNAKHFVLVAEDVIVHVVLLGGLRGEDERLHELSHGLGVVGELAQDLHDNAFVQGSVGVHLPDLGLAVAEVKLHDFLVDCLLAVDRLQFLVPDIKTAMNEG